MTASLSNPIKNGLIAFWCCLLIAAIMPAYSYYLPPIMIIWGIAWLTGSNLRSDFSKLNSKPGILLILFLCFYLWQITGLLFSESIESGVDRIVKRLSFLMFPLVLFVPGERIERNINLILKIFAVSALAYVLFCLVNAFYNSISIEGGNLIFNPHPTDFPYENYFISTRFTTAKIHTTYISVYLVLAILVGLENSIDKSSRLQLRITWGVITFFLLTGVYLFSSRTAFIIVLIVLPFYFFIKTRHRLKKRLMFGVMILMFTLLGWIILTNKRISYDIEKFRTEEIQNVLEKEVRITVWKSALNVIKKDLVTGVGTGDAHNQLTLDLTRAGYTDEFYAGLDTHNQFLEIQLENGIIGLLLFILLIGYMIYISLSESNLIYGLFIVTCITFFLFETALNRLAGISFFSFFSFLLLHYKTWDSPKSKA